LGNFYLPTNSPLINASALWATNVGLYHFTTQTNQTKEGSSLLDIGYHYVAVDGNGKPVDSDGDGLADYFEDTTGDGTYNSGDLSNWNSPDTDGDGISDFDEMLNHTDPLTPNPALPSSLTILTCPR